MAHAPPCFGIKAAIVGTLEVQVVPKTTIAFTDLCFRSLNHWVLGDPLDLMALGNLCGTWSELFVHG